MTKAQDILVRYGLISIPTESGHEHLNEAQLATLMSNISFYGYALNEEGLSALNCLSLASATVWWEELKEILERITGADKKMGEAIVYRNFPAEVLAMDDATYWGKQILMYWGFSADLFREPIKDRPLNTEKIRLRVLQLDDGTGLERIQMSLMAAPARWTAEQTSDAKELAPRFAHLADLSAVKFKENMVELAKILLEVGAPFKSTSATDVLRLAIGLSGGDISMRTNTKFARFPNKTRKFLSRALGNCRNLQEDMARDPERWKRLVKAIHPGDHTQAGDGVLAAVDALYKGTLAKTFNSIVETKLAKKDKSVLEDLQKRPGEFMRRLRVCIQHFNMDAAEAFVKILPQLTTFQMLKIEGFLDNFNDRSKRLYPPKANWAKVQVADPAKEALIPFLPVETIIAINDAIGKEIKSRLDKTIGSVNLDERTKGVKLQDNDSTLTPFGKGTRFFLPPEIKFVRTASYWKHGHTVWFDNGVNFFDANWKPAGTLCWNSGIDPWNAKTNQAAVFSGDPVGQYKGACQMIDCYIDRLAERGIRYAVWNILCYSNISFDESEVHAALQWGVEPQHGQAFDPARAQLSFPIKGSGKSKFITYLDVEKRELVYLDMTLPARVHSAKANEGKLAELMPAIVERLDSAPSIYDLFKNQKHDAGAMPVMYDDIGVKIESRQAYVFRQSNIDNAYEQLNINELLK